MIAQEGMTETAYSRDAIEEARRDSNSVFAFAAEHERAEFLIDPNVEVWYWRYCDYVRDSGGKAFDQRTFSRFLCTRLGLTTANDGRYRVGDAQLCLGEPARHHGRRPGDKYRVFREKSR
ncbi:MAG: hypothetical protein IJ781_03525 [Atopobiaceae bacterium]|nr:hypothetical protein [Atopobiaceae bacterium]